jgi:hypothetical protein
MGTSSILLDNSKQQYVQLPSLTIPSSGTGFTVSLWAYLFINDTPEPDDIDGTTIAGTFLSGAFDSVEELRVMTDGRIILEGIEARQYPSMKQLALWGMICQDSYAIPLGRALAQGSFPKLETLDAPCIPPNRLLRDIQTACRGSLMPNLREVGVSLYSYYNKKDIDKQLVADFRAEFPNIILRDIDQC